MPERHEESVREVDSRVWDMVLNLVHPAALYVLFQLLILDRAGRVAPWSGLAPLHPAMLAVYAFQFLGAWAVFYTTLLRDMGLRCAWGTVLLLCGLAGAVAGFVLLREPDSVSPALASAMLGLQAALALIAWPLTFRQWRRCRARHEAPGSAMHTAPGWLVLAQQFGPDASGRGAQHATDWFYEVGVWIFVCVPVAGAILLAALKRKRKPALPHVGETSWEAKVRDAAVPVLVHAYREWSIGDKVIEAQVLKLAEAAKGRLAAYWLDVETNPGILSLYPTLDESSVALFRGRELVWQCKGVHDHLTMLREIDRHLPEAPAA